MNQLFQRRTNMNTPIKNILLLSAVTITLAACTGADKQECWRATHKTVSKDCNSGNSTVSKVTPNIKVKDKKKTTDNTTPDADTDVGTEGGTNTNNPATPEPNNDSNNDNNNDTDTGSSNPSSPNQGSSGDIEGYDPFDNVYGPGT